MTSAGKSSTPGWLAQGRSEGGQGIGQWRGPVSFFEQPGHQAGSDIAGGPRDEYRPLSVIRWSLLYKFPFPDITDELMEAILVRVDGTMVGGCGHHRCPAQGAFRRDQHAVREEGEDRLAGPGPGSRLSREVRHQPFRAGRALTCAASPTRVSLPQGGARGVHQRLLRPAGRVRQQRRHPRAGRENGPLRGATGWSTTSGKSTGPRGVPARQG